MTNYERIRNMSVEEMAELFAEKMCICPDGNPLYNDDCINDKCEKCLKKWLESEVEEL